MRRKMRRCLTILILAPVVLLSACSFTTNFVVVNESAQAVVVKYRIKDSRSEPFQVVGGPAKLDEANLRDREKQWQVLKDGEYQLDRETRTVTVELLPHEALRVQQTSNYSSHDDEYSASKFEIEEITLSGASGELKIRGEQTRRYFVEETDTLYVLSYK
jgi:hypothetical protein